MSDAAAANRAMVGRLDYPMFVVTATDGDEVSGCLAGFVTQCSIEPARYMVCVSKLNHTCGVAGRSAGLGLHLLGADQHEVAAIFGELTGDRTDKFRLVRWHTGSTGVPLLDECSAWIESTVRARIDLGDHIGHLLDPVAGGAGHHDGLLPFSRVHDLSPGHPA